MIEFYVPGKGNPAATYVLPRNPVFSNSVAVDSTVDIKRTMDGTLYSYVKSNSNRFQIVMQFDDIPYIHSHAMSVFFRSYAGLPFTLVDHDGVDWVNTRFDQTDIEFTIDGRRGPESSFMGSPLRREHSSFELRFIGEKT